MTDPNVEATDRSASRAVAQRLEALLREAFGADHYVARSARIAGCSVNTMRRMLAAETPLDMMRVARLAAEVGFSIDGLLGGTSVVPSRQSQSMVAAAAETVDIPILATTASAGDGNLPVDPIEERGAMAFPRIWARQFGTPARLRLVEIAGDSMAPELDDGDWLLINLDLVELREGVALVRLDDALYVKRLQPQGRKLLLTSTNPAYHPIAIDLQAEGDRVQVIGRGRWSGKALR